MRIRLAVVTLTLALSVPTAQAQPTEADTATRELRRVLGQRHAREMAAGHRIGIRRDSRPYGRVIRAAVEPALYPGTGVASVVIGADGRSYGQHGRHDVAALVRALGWLRTAPRAADVKALLSDALFEGMLASHGDGDVRLDGGALVYTVVRAEPMSGDEVERLELRVEARGDARLTRTPTH